MKKTIAIIKENPDSKELDYSKTKLAHSTNIIIDDNLPDEEDYQTKLIILVIPEQYNDKIEKAREAMESVRYCYTLQNEILQDIPEYNLYEIILDKQTHYKIMSIIVNNSPEDINGQLKKFIENNFGQFVSHFYKHSDSDKLPKLPHDIEITEIIKI